MTDVVLDTPWAFEPSTGLIPWLATLWRQFRNTARFAAATKEEQELVHLVEYAASHLGDPILHAASLDDLDDRLEEALSGPEVFHLNALAARLAAEVKPRDAPKADELASTWLSVLGAHPARRMADCAPLLDAWVRATQAIVAEGALDHEDAGALAERTGEATGWALLTRPDIPPEVATGIAAGLRADLCAFALVRALEVNVPAAPWLASALVERFVDGVRGRLILIASLRPSLVSPGVIPMGERLDIPTIVDRHRRARAHAARTLEEERHRRGLSPQKA